MLKTTMKLGMSAYLRHSNSRADSVGSSGHQLKKRKKLKDETTKKECVLKDCTVFGVRSPHKLKKKKKEVEMMEGWRRGKTNQCFSIDEQSLH